MADASVQQVERRNRIAQWAYDTRPVLGRFHLWLEDVEIDWISGSYSNDFSFMTNDMERCFTMTTAVTALGTYLFGRYGEGHGLDKHGMNQVKKDADAVSAYVMSEGLWYLSRSIPENHAVMVCLGEGLMPKAGETPEMGSNPLLGFGRIYARPMVAKALTTMVARLLNDETYGFADFYREVTARGITIWGTAIDTLENTSRFAKGEPTGPMAVLHVFNQPLTVTKPFEGYMGGMFVPRAVYDKAEDLSVLLNFLTPRRKVMEVIEATYPGIKRNHVHVWTLRGKSREGRIAGLWKEWEDLGAHVIDDDWKLPSGMNAFTESGTYAPTYHVRTWRDDDGFLNVLLVDGYAASAEAMQAASLAEALDVYGSLVMYSSTFKLPYDRERQIMRLDPHAEDFADHIDGVFGKELDQATQLEYRECILDAHAANMPMGPVTFTADEFFPEKKWRILALSGYMLPDPYSNAPGVEKINDQTFRVSVRAATKLGDARIKLTMRLMEPVEESKLIFSPLLDRFFMRGREYYENRAVRVSDSGRIRNELQTLAPLALEFLPGDRMRLDFSKVDNDVLSAEKKAFIIDVLRWYKQSHPVWFAWLELA